MFRSASLFLVLLFLPFIDSFAQSDPASIQLTSADVSNFIGSFPTIKTELEAIDIQLMQSDNNITLPEGVEILNKVNTVVQKHGYSDYSDFLLKAGTIITAYTSVEFGREAGSIQPEIQEAIREIEKNPYYSDEQKKEMKEALAQSVQAMENYSKSASTDQNVELVKPYVNEIRQMLEASDD